MSYCPCMYVHMCTQNQPSQSPGTCLGYAILWLTGVSKTIVIQLSTPIMIILCLASKFSTNAEICCFNRFNHEVKHVKDCIACVVIARSLHVCSSKHGTKAENTINSTILIASEQRKCQAIARQKPCQAIAWEKQRQKGNKPLSQCGGKPSLLCKWVHRRGLACIAVLLPTKRLCLGRNYGGGGRGGMFWNQLWQLHNLTMDIPPS